MRAPILTVVCGVLLAGGLSAAPVPKMKEKTTEQKLLGKWKLVKSDVGISPAYEFVIEYKAKGEMVFHRTPLMGGIPASASEGKFKTGPDTIDWTVTESGIERGEKSKILTLTDDKLVFEDPAGIKEEFERVVEKKKDDEKKDAPKKEEPKKDEK